MQEQVLSTAKSSRHRRFFRVFQVYMNYGMRNDGQYEMDSASLGYYDVAAAAQSYQPVNQIQQMNGLANPASVAGPSQPHFAPTEINQSMEASSTAHKYNLRRKRGPSVVEIDENDDEVQYAGDFLNYGLAPPPQQPPPPPPPPPPQQQHRSETNHQQQQQQQQRSTTTFPVGQRGQVARRPQQRTRGSYRGGRNSRNSNQARLRPVAPRSNAQFHHGGYGDATLMSNYGQQQRQAAENVPAAYGGVAGNQMAYNHQQYFLANQYGGSNVIDLTRSQESPSLASDAAAVPNRNSVLINYGASGSTVYQHVPATSVCSDNALLYSQGAASSYALSSLRNQLRNHPKNPQLGSSAYGGNATITAATATPTAVAAATATATAAASDNDQSLVPVKREYINRRNYYTIKFDRMDRSTSTNDDDHYTIMFPSPKSKGSGGAEKTEGYYPQVEYQNATSNYLSQAENGLVGARQISMVYCSTPANRSSQRNETFTSQEAMDAETRNSAQVSRPLTVPQANEGFNFQNEVNNDRKYTAKGMSDLDKYVADYYLGKFEEKPAVVVPEQTSVNMELIPANQNAGVPSFNSLSLLDLDSFLNNLGKEEVVEVVENKRGPVQPGMSYYENVVPAVYQPNVVVQPAGTEAALASQVSYGQQRHQQYTNYRPQQSNNVFSAKQGKCIIQNVQNNVTYNVHQGQYNPNVVPQNNGVANDNGQGNCVAASTSQYVDDTRQHSLSLDFFNDTLMPWEHQFGDTKPPSIFDTMPQNLCQVGAQFRQAQNVVNHNYYDMSNYGPVHCQQNLPPVTSIKGNKPNEANTFPAIEPKYPENE